MDCSPTVVNILDFFIGQILSQFHKMWTNLKVFVEWLENYKDKLLEEWSLQLCR